MGHTSRSCKSKPRCLRCGGQHAVSDCKTSTPLCANCDGDHYANSKSCPVLRAAQDRENARAKITRTATAGPAPSALSSTRHLPPGLPSVLESLSSNRSSYSNAVRHRQPIKFHTRTIGTQTSFRTIGTQTDDSDLRDTTLGTQTEPIDSSLSSPAPVSSAPASPGLDLSKVISLIIPRLIEAITDTLSSALPASPLALRQSLENNLVSFSPAVVSPSPQVSPMQEDPSSLLPSPRKSAVVPEEIDLSPSSQFLDPALCLSRQPSARRKPGGKTQKHRKPHRKR